MKKLAIITLATLFSLSGMAFAAADSTSDAGDAVTVDAGNVTGANDLVFTPSPSTIMAWNVTADSYALTSTSKKTKKDNGLIYGIQLNKTGYFQAQQAANGTLVTPVDATNCQKTGVTWKYMGGGEESSSS